jgi:hypothetical protein
MTPALAFLLLFVDRSRKAEEYPWLPWKVRIFLAGAALAVVGMAVDSNVLVGIAIGVLAFGFVIRFLPGGKGVVEGEEDADDPDDADEEWERA